MKKFTMSIAAAWGLLLILSSAAMGHVPIIEIDDFTQENPLVLAETVEKSIAVYAWLESEDDVDFANFDLRYGERVFVSTLVPRCDCYADFLPYFAVAGPGLQKSPSMDDYPIYTLTQYKELYGDGYPEELEFFDTSSDPENEYDGVLIVPNVGPFDEREEFFEFFAHKWYYGGPDFDMYPELAGTYRIFVWEPNGNSGDYVLEIGKKEMWPLKDVIRTFFVILPWLIFNGEIHNDGCNPRF
ncbi:MAG: hypothetical protein JW920_05585 [Deltaproteobacteria bacterium]|nr:hypothetical protein [Deltaproteobacteria bacterium]